MPPKGTINLGLIRAIHLGITAPLNKKIIWFDETVKIHKIYNFQNQIWVRLSTDLTDILLSISNKANLDAGNITDTLSWRNALDLYSKEQINTICLLVSDFVSNGKIRADKIESLALLDVIQATENTIENFATGSANYIFQKNDIIAIPDLNGKYSMYIYNGSAKTNTNSYLAFGVSNITISQVIGLQTALNLKVNNPTTVVDSDDSTNKWLILLNDAGNSVKMLISNIKNSTNSFLSTSLNAGVNMLYDWKINTNGFFFKILGLTDKSSDSTYNKILAIDANGNLAESSGNSIAINMPSYMTPAQKDRWFADMNSQTSFSGTSIITVIPPVIQRSSVAQNIIVKGLGLNLVTNFDATPALNRSYVGIFPDVNNNGIQDAGEADIPAINYSRVGDNQTIISQFLLDSSVALGKYKLKVKNAGIPAIGDAYITIVNLLTSIPYVQGNIILRSGTSSLNNTDISSVTLAPDVNIKPALGSNLASFTDLVSIWFDGTILSGSLDYWLNVTVIGNNSSGYSYGQGIAQIGLALSTANSLNSPSKSLISIIHYGVYSSPGNNVAPNVYLNSQSVQFEGNLFTIDYIKLGNILTTILTTSTQTLINTEFIDTSIDYKLAVTCNNSYAGGLYNGIRIVKNKLVRLN
jgi:hypothetical protein